MTQAQQAAGTLDPAFDMNGVVTLPFGDVVGSIPAAVLALPDNKLLVAVATTKPQNAPAKIARLEEDGSLDHTFGIQGIVEIPFDNGTWFSPRHLHPLTNEGWLITGTAERETEPDRVDMAVVRQLKDGTLDTTFGKDGKVTLNINDLIGPSSGARILTHRHDKKGDDKLAESAGGVGATAIAKQDGKIVLVSTVLFEFNNLKGIVIRLNKDGSLDTSFNLKGFLLVKLPGIEHVWNQASGVAVQQDGKVLVCGDFSRERSGERPGAYVIRYDQDGYVDAGYGDNKNGVVTIIDSSRWLNLGSMALKSDGGVVAMGSAESDRRREGLIASLNPSGSFNLVFNNGKPLFSNLTEHGVSWQCCVLQTDGKLVVSGQGGGVYVDENSSVVTARYAPDGSLDVEFAGKGWAVINDESGIDLFRGGTAMADNRVVVSGYVAFGPMPPPGYVVRYLA
ncbi:hypothetical protein [Pseudomonas sp. A-RE-19]|uniref:hypothetical protein n=1 Tax=Pseudomonas sp. A-RE-19 TaxID=2832401 RepID=UPI001CC01915|nr:hypothetical protein [Pseudomonas sp. A-RE-19]